MKFWIVLLILPALAMAFSEKEVKTLFYKWMDEHSRKYTSVEEMNHRFSVFHANLDRIAAHNAKKLSHTVGMNKFGDMTVEEFREIYLSKMKLTRSAPMMHKIVGDAPSSIDWRDKNAVTPVKDQAMCGSCWAFSTIGACEGAHAIATGTLVSLSEQQLVDCSTKNSGCNGGLMSLAFEYIIGNGGVDTEDCYPYEGYDDTCRYKASCIGAKFSSYVNVTSNDDSAMVDAVGNHGPVAVAIAADSLQFYTGGIFDDASCPTDMGSLDHGVLVVGYGTDTKDFYVLKNSWGEDWGEKGFFRFARGSSKNMCGLLDLPSYPISMN